MKTLKDPCPSYDLKAHSITLTDNELRCIDALAEKFDLKTRSAVVRACIQYTYYNLDMNLNG